MHKALAARSVPELISLSANGKRPKYICFWRHTPKVKGRVNHSCFSQWHPSPFIADGVHYATAEHYMMAAKARLFDDEESLARVLSAPSPAEAKAIGRKVRHFEQTAWIENRFSIVVAASVAKFSSSAELKSHLLSTARYVLFETSRHDAIWGIGLDPTAAEGKHPHQWKGQNLLGFALMEARQVLSDRGAAIAASFGRRTVAGRFHVGRERPS